MKSDPHEGSTALAPELRERFKDLIEKRGEASLRRSLASSALVLPGSALGLRIATALLNCGIGRVGVFGERPQTPLKTFKAWATDAEPWAAVETFSGESIDRRFDDMIRGFDLLIVVGALEAERVFALVKESRKTVLAAACLRCLRAIENDDHFCSDPASGSLTDALATRVESVLADEFSAVEAETPCLKCGA